MDLATFTTVSLALLILSLFAWFGWRFFSERHSLPCPTWLSWLVEVDNPFVKIAHASTIVKHLGLKTCMQVVDIGCGPGRVTLPVAHKVGARGRVTAMDIQKGMLDKARAKAKTARQTNITYLHAGVGEGRLGKDKFDRALLVTVLGEIPDQTAALHETFESLKPGGILSVTELIFDPHFQRRRTVVKLAEAAGFKEKARYGNAVAYTLNFVKTKK